MNRRKWLKWIPAAFLPMGAKGGRPTQIYQPVVPDGFCIGIKTDGSYGQVECPPSQIVPDRYLRWMSGKALNNQCPVCGTIAAALPALPDILTNDGRACNGPSVEGGVCLNGGVVYLHKLVRCLRCNNAFFQDAA